MFGTMRNVKLEAFSDSVNFMARSAYVQQVRHQPPTSLSTVLACVAMPLTAHIDVAAAVALLHATALAGSRRACHCRQAGVAAQLLLSSTVAGSAAQPPRSRQHRLYCVQGVRLYVWLCVYGGGHATGGLWGCCKTKTTNVARLYGAECRVLAETAPSFKSALQYTFSKDMRHLYVRRS